MVTMSFEHSGFPAYASYLASLRSVSLIPQLCSSSRLFAVFLSPRRAAVPRLRDDCCVASARRSFFFRRFARFLTLSLPRLCPIIFNLHPLGAIQQRDESEVEACVFDVVAAAAAVDAIPAAAPANPELA